MQSRKSNSWLLFANLLLALLYVLAAKFGLRLTTEARDVTLVWPAAALAIVALLRHGPVLVPGIMLGAGLTNALVTSHLGFASAAAIGNPLEALVAWWLLRRFDFHSSLGRLRDPLLLTVVAFASPIAAALTGSTALCISGLEPWSRFSLLLFSWWLGDGMGILIVAPVLLTWSDAAGRAALGARPYSASLLAGATLVLAAVAFVSPLPTATAELFVFAFFPVVLTSAARLGPIGAAGTVFLTACLAVGGTYFGRGPFSDASIGRGLVYLHGFLGTLALSGLAPAALMWERRASERRLRQSEERFRSVVMSMAEGIVLQDAAGRILTANPRAESILGLTLDQMIGRTSLDLRWRAIREDGSPFPGDEHPAMVTLRTGAPCRDVLMGVHRPDGSLTWLAINSEPVRAEGSAPAEEHAPAVVATFHDITQRRADELQRQRAERLESLGTLAGGLAHDLNNVFAPIRLGIDYIAEKIDDAGGRRMLEVMESGVTRGAALVGQILAYVRGSSGSRSIVSLPETVREVEGWIRRTFPDNVAIRVELEPNLPAVSADPTQLYQALLNLCLNARDAMPAGGELVLSVALLRPVGGEVDRGPHERRVVIRVTDTGHGIAPELQARIFEPFFTGKTFGTGLGLPMVQSIVRAHGGIVSLESKPGSGATFSILLPPEGATPIARTTGVEPEVARGNGELILIVEDDPGVRDATTRMLEHSGYLVLGASDGNEALELMGIHGSHISLVISDVCLPQFDGHELLRRIRGTYPSLPVIIVSGLPMDEIEGAFACLHKPYTLSELLIEIRRAIPSAAG